MLFMEYVVDQLSLQFSKCIEITEEKIRVTFPHSSLLFLLHLKIHLLLHPLFFSLSSNLLLLFSQSSNESISIHMIINFLVYFLAIPKHICIKRYFLFGLIWPILIIGVVGGAGVVFIFLLRRFLRPLAIIVIIAVGVAPAAIVVAVILLVIAAARVDVIWLVWILITISILSIRVLAILAVLRIFILNSPLLVRLLLLQSDPFHDLICICCVVILISRFLENKVLIFMLIAINQ